MGVQYPLLDKSNRSCQVFSVNNEYEASQFLGWVKTHRPGQSVVYGATLTAYTMVQAMLSAGLVGPQICLVLPPGPTPFNNLSVEEKVIRVLVELGVMVQRGHILTKGEGNGLVLEAEDGTVLSVPCEVRMCKCALVNYGDPYKVLLCADKKAVGPRGFTGEAVPAIC